LGGFGSGKWDRSGVKRTAESCQRIDVRRWQREGRLEAGTRFGWSWTREGKKLADIGVLVGERRLTLEYRYRQGEAEWEDVVEDVPLVWTDCNYGGRRAWLICPGVKNGVPCRRRVAILYLGGRYFLCRDCYDLVYESQREDEMDQPRRKAQKIRVKLGGSANLLERLPDRPKGMRELTYWALQAEYYRLELAREAIFEGQLLGMARRYGWLDQLGGTAVEG
jgi:hypothetical protein